MPDSTSSEPLVMITIRMTKSERWLLRRAAEIDGESMQSWCKDMLVQVAQDTVDDNEPAEKTESVA